MRAESRAERGCGATMLKDYLSVHPTSSSSCAQSGHATQMSIDFGEIGSRLRAARLARGLTQAQVARKVKVTYQAVSLVEKGKIRAIDTIEDCAAALGCPMVVHVGQIDDEASLLLVRIARTLPTVDPAVLKMLDAWVRLWEEDQARTSGGPSAHRPAS